MEKVIVLLASYNGEKYLRDQLDRFDKSNI